MASEHIIFLLNWSKSEPMFYRFQIWILMRKGTNLTNYSLTQNFRDIERIYKISFSKPIDNGMQQLLNTIIIWSSLQLI